MENAEAMIEQLRQHLQAEAEKTGYNFLDPRIVRISQELDRLIVASMLPLIKQP
ncbi:aspartyl-phosphate phosphatase Spo0E family protein [Brevibacillus sp. SYP-B805]|uniref:aspartyl-phosphate phosphatase Spo0E family protein n=1 Tax=Brevibacillus sp. SYP-B805 TaxID=1578199 RepID=UPI0013EDFC0E|nr:aspartyl-phosphate phosphatase Spo0E family protein [Brevibacillus sp. SYP-B805]NGQ96342.1 aspartyl-phosphate phosphatase Spo0E family protein [Brevibacillus sp. SYP-B805]